jgi:hypothetical protein
LLATACAVAILAGVCTLVFFLRTQSGDAPVDLALQPARLSDEIACPRGEGSEAPLLLLVLGQSNAANHGETRSTAASGAAWLDGHCYRIADPFPGGTGAGGSIWSRLASAASTAPPRGGLIVAVFAIDASRMGQWIEPGPVSTNLASIADSLRAHQLTVSAVLWQQGEADARNATSREDYSAGLTILIHRLREAGISAPVLLARSTRCRNTPNDAIRSAMAGIADHEPNVYLGPDTDTLGDDYRFDGCHFNDAGLQRAASMWLDSLRRHGLVAAP